MSVTVKVRPERRVWITIEGSRVKDAFKVDDDGFVACFYSWMKDNCIHRVDGGMVYEAFDTNNGHFSGAFKEQDAEKIVAWLNQQPEVLFKEEK